ncbi:MAG: glycine--tRNA ligase subunit beta, partial [Thiohalocapsa sp.]
MEQNDELLVEIGTEELPPTALKRLSEAFAIALSNQLAEHNLSHGETTTYASPRRLALLIRGVAIRQPDQDNLRRGPALAAAFDGNGEPTKAALGFARSCGVEVGDLDRDETAKGTWLVHRQQVEGQRATNLLPRLITNSLARLPIPRRMRWGDGDEEFVRPLHWVCVRFGTELVQGRVLGVEIGSSSRGHRFHHPGPVAIDAPHVYAEAMRAAHVEPSLAARRDRIRDQATELAASVGGEVHIPEDLLDEVASLCEWPIALLGQFEDRFLEVPPEALVETMQKNQKYFPVFDRQTALRPYFITVSNIESRDPDVVRAGNERVIRPRFSDAMFFWEQDRKRSLADRQSALSRVVFERQLGSVWDKAKRVSTLAVGIAEQLGYDQALAERAALIGKCDLVTLMVGEFASLQGTMGRYYAQHDGEDACVVAAMEEQYLPRHAGDRLPSSACGRVLALADKLDTLIGIFAIGQRPTGVKDPYGLRRAAIGVMRILIETPLPLDLKILLEQAADAYRGSGVDAAGTMDAVYTYITDRLPGYFAERGIGGDLIDAVLAAGSSVPSDIERRVAAVAAFRELDAAEALAAANKRIRNILRKSGENQSDRGIRAEQLVEPAEQRLAQRIEALGAEIAPLLRANDYDSVLRTLAGLRKDVDRFFDEVMVMAEEPELRANRIAV